MPHFNCQKVTIDSCLWVSIISRLTSGQCTCTLHITIATIQYSINETQTNCLVDTNEIYKRVVLLMVSVNKTICNNPQTAFKGISK